MLDDIDRGYVAKRRNSLRFLGLATWALPVIWVIFVFVGVWRFPALIDPLSLARELDTGIVDWQVVRALARVAPMLFLTLLLVISGAIFIFLRGAYRERRLLEVVERLERGSVTPP